MRAIHLLPAALVLVALGAIGGVAQLGHPAPAGQQVLEELAALGLLTAGNGEEGALEPFRGRLHRIVRGVQHGQDGGAQHGE